MVASAARTAGRDVPVPLRVPVLTLGVGGLEEEEDEVVVVGADAAIADLGAAGAGTAWGRLSCGECCSKGCGGRCWN